MYSLKASNRRCTVEDSILVVELSRFEFPILQSGDLCEDEEMQLYVSLNGANYRWNTEDITVSITTFTLNTFSMYIYDRWGNQVFQSNTFASWGGKRNNGIETTDGVYFCVVFYTCMDSPDKIRTAQSSITVFR